MFRLFGFFPGNILALVSFTLMLSGNAYAHAGHEINSAGFLAGLTHPLLGLDHIVAMIAIGLWSMSQAPKFRPWVPLYATLGMLLGAMSAWVGLVIPAMEFVIAMSVVLTGVLVFTLAKFPAPLGASVVVLFLFCHGHAHGSEMPVGIASWAYLAGFLVTTLIITYVARRVGYLLISSEKRLLHMAGVAITALGALFAIG